jgi:hypothetical protein
VTVVTVGLGIMLGGTFIHEYCPGGKHNVSNVFASFEEIAPLNS